MRKKFMLCVRPGVLEVRARPLRLRSELISEDFPTFERPKNAISGRRSATQCELSKALLINSADLIFTGREIKQKNVRAEEYHIVPAPE
jgi:hypothetical protein